MSWHNIKIIYYDFLLFFSFLKKSEMSKLIFSKKKKKKIQIINFYSFYWFRYDIKY